ncbi:hypothetical protein LEMLEM_LOCUS18710 [Lemmus lemmus]
MSELASPLSGAFCKPASKSSGSETPAENINRVYLVLFNEHTSFLQKNLFKDDLS